MRRALNQFAVLFSIRRIALGTLLFVYSTFAVSCMGGRSVKSISYSQTCVLEFYQKLLTNQDFLDYALFPERQAIIVKNKEELSQGYNINEIRKIVEESRFFTDGEWMDTTVMLSFPNGHDIYFQLTDGVLNHIWMSDGRDLMSKPISLYRRPAIIRDVKIGGAIREKADGQSNIVGRFQKEELFYYTPVSGMEWFRVYRDEASPCIGYIHKSEIVNYDDFPTYLQEMIRDRLSGC